MNKNIYIVGTVALAFAMSGLPAFALAENNGTEGQGDASAQVRVQALGATATATSVTAQVGEDQQKTNQVEPKQTQGSTFGERQASSSDTQASSTRPAIKGGEDANENVQSDINLKLESTTTPAFSFGQLQKSIEQRKQELDQEEASTTPKNRDIVKNANPVRLAVHALLASKDLIGGIGQQVSDIAQQMNDSVASTTDAEAKIQSRGFFAHLFFGGDTASADVIAQAATQNQARIDSLTALLAQANISADVKATLTAQITALTDAQARLQTLATKEKAAWGLFSWRF
jgi:hypothetical protein